MAFKIKTADQKDVASALEFLSAARGNLDDAVRVFNEEVSAAKAKLAQAVDRYNEHSDAVRGKIEDIHRELDEEFDKKSEKWKDSDTGSKVKEWLDEINEVVEGIEEASLDGIAVDVELEQIVTNDPETAYAQLEKEAPTE